MRVPALIGGEDAVLLDALVALVLQRVHRVVGRWVEVARVGAERVGVHRARVGRVARHCGHAAVDAGAGRGHVRLVVRT